MMHSHNIISALSLQSPSISPTETPTTLTPSTASPTPTTPPTTLPPTPTRRELRHHEIILLGIIFTVIAFCIFVFALLWKYNRSKLRYLYYRMKYFLCCCRLSEQDIQRQNEEDDTPVFDTINDLLFGVRENDEVARVNVSALTDDGDDTATIPSLPVEVSVKSFFPDLLAGMESNDNNNLDAAGSNDNNNLQEPLLNNSSRAED